MNFKHLIGQYVLGYLPTEQLPQVAYIGLEEGFDSPSLVMLAGIEKGENSFIIEKYFKAALSELNIHTPDKKKASLEYGMTIAQEIIDGKKNIFEGVGEIIHKVIRRGDFESYTTTYLYDGIFFESVYGLYYEYDDLENDMMQVSGDKSREQLILETKQDLLQELTNWIAKVRASDLMK